MELRPFNLDILVSAHLKTKNKMERIDATTARVIEKMTKPRMGSSARIAESKPDPARIPTA
jgi:hypothetical protein